MTSILSAFIKKFSLVTIALLVFTNACARPDDDESDSDVLWGTLGGGPRDILSIGPDAKPIGVCYEASANATLANYVRNGVKIWADTISRSKLVPADVKPCTQVNKDNFSKLIAVRKTNKGSCTSAGVVGYYDGASINFCTRGVIGTEIVALHEVGHAYGLCDQYSPGALTAAFNGNCSGGAGLQSEKAQSNSIMGAGQNISIIGKWLHLSLYQDDIVGIRILSCLADSPSNTAWGAVNRQQIQEWKKDSKFVSEIKRTKNLGTRFLDACL